MILFLRRILDGEVRSAGRAVKNREG